MTVEKCQVVDDCRDNSVTRLGVETNERIEPMHICARHFRAYQKLNQYCDLRSRLDQVEEMHQ